MATIPDIDVNITIVIGSTHMPISQLLKMGRGAVISLDAKQNDPVDIYANNELVARGQVVVSQDRVSVEVTERIGRTHVADLHSVA